MAEEVATSQNHIQSLQGDPVTLTKKVNDLEQLQRFNDSLIKHLREIRISEFKTMKVAKDSLEKLASARSDTLVEKNKTINQLQSENQLLHIMIEDPGKDSLLFLKGKEEATNIFKAEKDSLNQIIHTLDSSYKSCYSEKYPWTFFDSASGCAVLIAIIIAVTLVAFKKGFSISKGNAKICIGNKDD